MSAPTDRLPDVRSLISEIERLRCAAMELREATDDVMNNAWEDGTREERQNVVAWLRAGVHHHRGFGFHLIGDELEAYADHIERGEHRREET